MEYSICALAAFIVSGLTLYSGFGLGTLLMPVFALFFPMSIAVAATAVVHLLSNIYKLFLVGRLADKQTVLKFGLPAIVSAFLGALVLAHFAGQPPFLTYELWGKTRQITALKLILSILIFSFAVLEILPQYKKLAFDRKYLPFGGLLSGFFGGLSGHQGALRSAFLIRSGLSHESFIGTGVVIAVLVDFVRLFVYSAKFIPAMEPSLVPLLFVTTIAAFAGAWLGNRFIKKMTLPVVQGIVSAMLFLIAILIAAGLN